MSVPGVAAFHDGGGGGGGVAQGPGTAIADNKVVRGDTSGIQGSGITISDADVVSDVTQLNVDNLRLDGNTISSTNANGNVVVAPNGTGQVEVPFGTKAAPGLAFTTALTRGLYGANGATQFSVGGVNALAVQSDFLVVRSTVGYGASSGEPDTNGPDVGMVRDSGGGSVWRDTNGSTGLGYRQTGRVVEASTAGVGSPNLLAVTESRKLLTNEGTTAEAYHTLPSAAAGVEFLFYCQDADGLRVVAGAGDTIRIGASVSAAAGFVRSSTIGSSLQLVAINATEWVAVSSSGTWTIDA